MKIFLFLFALFITKTIISQTIHLNFSDSSTCYSKKWFLQKKDIRIAHFKDSTNSFSTGLVDYNEDGFISLTGEDLIFIDFYKSDFIYSERNSSSALLKENCIIESEGVQYKINSINSLGIDVTILKSDKIEKFDIQKFNSLPNLTFKSFEDSTISLNQLLTKDKFLLIEIWSIYCLPCIKSFPLLNEYQAKYRDKLTILTLLDMDNDPELKKLAIQYKVNGGITQGYSNQEINNEFNRSGYPNYFLFDGNGILVEKGVRAIDMLKRFD